MSESLLASVVVVLYEPQDPVNIAATIRAMKNMGVSRLRLVRPVPYEEIRLEGIAHRTMEIIERIDRFETFDEAVADCVATVGFTARRRAAKLRVIDPKQAAADLLALAPDGPVALVFGREDNGLPNEILDRVHAAVTIPTTNHASLNLAQAALIALYELHLAAADATRELAPPRKDAPPPDQRAVRALLRRRRAESGGDRVLQDALPGAHHAHVALTHPSRRAEFARVVADARNGDRSGQLFEAHTGWGLSLIADAGSD
jgi:tRNA/rRNA methyltransferase/tRNA (cytidine32/uridine32-2'-O)-methyltransferase